MKIALVGGRGYTGAELLALLAAHPALELAFASSGSQAGLPLRAVCPQWPDAEQQFVTVTPETVATQHADAWVLAVPNGAAAAWARAIGRAHPDAVVLDLSADHRFDDSWVYGWPERNRDALRSARRIANPGCYATGMQTALYPLLDQLADEPRIFGVSGYSGAGKTPSPKNDPDRLRDNLIPYQLSGHIHEREVSHQLARPVRFAPHVAAFFRGISLTLSATLKEPMAAGDIQALFESRYGREDRIQISAAIPEVSAVQGTPDIHVGGFTVSERDPRAVTWVCVLDNLLKGAASQALQNLNLALGLDEQLGVSS
jgi:N-acetyl-gamma-glutamyl-phosphate reductase